MYILCCICVFMYYSYPLFIAKTNPLISDKDKERLEDTYILPALIVISIFWIIVLPIFHISQLFENRKERLN